MPEIDYSEAFVSEAQTVQYAKKRQELRKNIELLADFPEIGSRNVSDYLARTYGEGVRRLVVNPFVVVYEYDAESNAVHVLGLVHQRAAW